MKRRNVSKRKINLKFAIQLLILTTAISSFMSMSKFQKSVDGESEAIVAIPILDSATITLDNINPQTQRDYTIQVDNSKDNKINEVSLNYNIKVENIGVIPLKIELYKAEDTNKQNNLLKDGVTDFIKMPIYQDSHNYKLYIQWDNSKEDYSNYIYSGEVNYIKIDVDAVQVD